MSDLGLVDGTASSALYGQLSQGGPRYEIKRRANDDCMLLRTTAVS